MIDGTITANGRVFIINRDGMLFGRGAVINTAGFLATTNDIRNADFMAGRMNFNIPGRGNASIVNFGTITASSGGFAALVAPGVRNAGTISAHLGTVALASGNSFTLDMYGDKLIQVAVGDSIADKVIDVATGKPLSSLVSNEGTLRANGGRVEITAAAARHIVNSVINNKGVIEANSVGTRAGRIVLGGATQTAGPAEADDQDFRKDQRHRQGQGPEGRHHPDHRRGHPVRGGDARRLRAFRRRQDPGRRRLRRRQAAPGRRQQSERGARRLRDPDRVDRHGRRRDHVQRLGHGERPRRQGDPVVGRA